MLKRTDDLAGEDVLRAAEPIPPAHILVVDDDRELRALLSGYLQQHGYRASVAADGFEMRRVLGETHVDLVVLDVMMPGVDGLTLCRELRKVSLLPIILLTALDDAEERITGIDAGADDYLVKPFNPRELLGRIRAVSRRAARASRSPLPYTPRGYRFDGWRLDMMSRTLQPDDGPPVRLTASEFQLLVALVSRPMQLVSRAQLVDLVRVREGEAFSRSIDVRVSRLRTLLGEDARAPALIQTVYGQGYILSAEVTPD